MPNYIAFLSVLLISTFTPGPNNIMSMANAAKYGFRKSIPFNYGILAGFVVIMSMCSLLSNWLGEVVPSIRVWMQFLGAGYILWLAWKIFKSSNNGLEGNVGKNTFMTGFLMQFVNPKVILFGITLISSFVTPYYQNIYIILIFGLIIAIVGFAATCCWAIFGAVFQGFFRNNSKLANNIMAALLVLCSVSMIH